MMMDETNVVIATDGLSDEDRTLIEAALEVAKQLEDERQRTLNELAQEHERVFIERMGSRGLKESEWTCAQDLFMGKLSVSKNGRVFADDPDRARDKGSVAKDKYRVNLVRPKVKSTVAQLVAAQFGGGEKNWNLMPSKRPEIDTNVNADNAVKAMEDVIEDQLEETDYAREYKRGILDLLVLGTMILKGPVNSGRLKKIWAQEMDPETGAIYRRPQMIPEYIPCVKRVDPWFFFPDTTVTRIDDASDTIEVHPMSKRDLLRLRNHPGYLQDQLEEVLKEEPTLFQAARLAPTYAFANSDLFKNKYLVIERHGPLDKDCLCKLGVDLPFSDERETYWSEVWSVNGKVIRIELSNLETADSVPYAVDVWEEDPSSIFGFGLPLLVEDQQRISDGIWSHIVLNAKLTSGPQVGINRTMIQPMEDGSHDIEPWKVWSIDEYGADIKAALQFYEVPNRQDQLAAVLQLAKGFADEEASIPPLLGGQESPELTSGATGAAMVYKAATSLLHNRAEQLDDNITQKVIGWMYDWNMQYNKDETIKGDYEVDVRSSTSYLRQHMEMINLEKLITQTSQNPDLQRVVKTDEAARALVAGLQLPSNKLIRNEQEVQQWEQEQQQKQQPDPKMMEIQIKQQELELKQKELEQKQQQLLFEQQQGMQKAQMEYEERQEANDARIAEAQASVLKEQAKRDQAYIQYATRTQMEKAKLDADINIKQRDLDIKEFQIGVQAEIDANKQALTKEEMQLRRETGSGV